MLLQSQGEQKYNLDFEIPLDCGIAFLQRNIHKAV